jgi:hypothetical protein
MNKATFSFNKWNTILGWVTFNIALLTYTLTVEPTMSFGMVNTLLLLQTAGGHPLGSLFQMIGAFFAMFAMTINILL